MSNPINLICDNYLHMSKGHKKIADFIRENYDKAAFMTAAKLGETVLLSESTVVRFAMELGYDGYPALQQALTNLMRTKLTSVQRIEMTSNHIGDADVLEKVLNLDIERIRTTLEQSSRIDFSNAIDAIILSETIYIVGSRSAEILARFLTYYLKLMFPDVRLLYTTGESELFQQLVHLTQNDVVIGISFPRYSKQTTKVMKYASVQQAKVVAITDAKTSPIAAHANHILLAKSDMVSFADSLVAPLSLINAIIVAIGIKRRDEVSQNLGRLEKIWEEYEVYEKN